MFLIKKKFNSTLNEELSISIDLERIILNSINKNGDCKICISGGSSPNKSLIELSKSNKIDWSKVIFFLTDERITSLSSDQSNYGNLKTIFKHTSVTIKPFYDGFDEDKSVFRYQNHIKKYLKSVDQDFDLLILGFGED